MLRKCSYFLNSTMLKTTVFVSSDNFESFSVNYEANCCQYQTFKNFNVFHYSNTGFLEH